MDVEHGCDDDENANINAACKRQANVDLRNTPPLISGQARSVTTEDNFNLDKCLHVIFLFLSNSWEHTSH